MSPPSLTLYGSVKINSSRKERETSAQPKNEDRIKRLGDENKKLIHLVTALDQQVTVLEGKLNRSDLQQRFFKDLWGGPLILDP